MGCSNSDDVTAAKDAKKEQEPQKLKWSDHKKCITDSNDHFMVDKDKVKVLTKSPVFQAITQTEIPQDQVKFKYIQIWAKPKVKDLQTHVFIRAYKKTEDCQFHDQQLAKFSKQNENTTIEHEGQQKNFLDLFELTVPGGGKIKVNKEKNSMYVCGKSMAFGMPDHRITVKLLELQYGEQQGGYYFDSL